MFDTDILSLDGTERRIEPFLSVRALLVGGVRFDDAYGIDSRIVRPGDRTCDFHSELGVWTACRGQENGLYVLDRTDPFDKHVTGRPGDDLVDVAAENQLSPPSLLATPTHEQEIGVVLFGGVQNRL